MAIYGYGLIDNEREALQQLLEARGQVPLKERKEIEIPPVFIERASDSRLFSFWFQLGLLKQDKPFRFWVGFLFFIYAALSTLVQISIKLIHIFT